MSIVDSVMTIASSTHSPFLHILRRSSLLNERMGHMADLTQRMPLHMVRSSFCFCFGVIPIPRPEILGASSDRYHPNLPANPRHSETFVTCYVLWSLVSYNMPYEGKITKVSIGSLNQAGVLIRFKPLETSTTRD